ncbi:MAG: virulence protein [Lachnospiraceae bacterium]|nr:virulence protein [Lachnospiraceae bacterium]MCH4028369.1 virulence protein [Lachnospiraceae bacterium]MCH4066215.1 virulence protein [Lachnospiraceae bacterium]MCH4112249.1 virulence protein [Lachnospiraceae bacterium]
MKANYNLAGTKRKELVQAIAEITGEKADYMRMPTCAYEIGDITVDKDGGVSCSDEEKMQMVMKALNEKGFTAEEDAETKQPEQAETTEPEHTTEEEKETAEDEQEPALTISLPLASANVGILRNLISAKESLIKKALGITDTRINITDEKIEFPWFDRELTPEETNAYMLFLTQLCKLSKELKHASSKPVETDNEKYAFRTWLLRMGFIGPDFKAARKILLKNLSGSSAFRNGAPTKEVEA